MKLTAIASLSSAALAAWLTWWAVSGNWEAKYNALQRDQAQAVGDAQQRLRERRDATADAIAHIDDHYTRELTHAHDTIDSLRDDVAAGDRRLRIAATCTGGVPEDAGTASVADGPGARLTDAAERNYFRVRERAATCTEMIEGLQAYARECSGTPE